MTPMTFSNSSNAEKDYISWNPNLELGIEYIDMQHKHLVELCNKLHSEILQNGKDSGAGWKNQVAITLKECVNYVRTHFADEEKLMKLINYEGYDSHKKRHDEFSINVLETAKNFDTMSFTDAIKFAKFLYDWILSHIAHEDKLFVKPAIEFKKQRQNKND